MVLMLTVCNHRHVYPGDILQLKPAKCGSELTSKTKKKILVHFGTIISYFQEHI